MGLRQNTYIDVVVVVVVLLLTHSTLNKDIYVPFCAA